MRNLFIISLLAITIGCNNKTENKDQPKEEKYKTMGTIERLDSTLDHIISPTASPEIIAEGLKKANGRKETKIESVED